MKSWTTSLGITLSALLGFSLDLPAEEQDSEPQNNVIPAVSKPIGPGELYHLMDRACFYGDEMSVQILLNAGAEPDGVNDYKAFGRFEPMWHLQQAAYEGHLKIVDMLLRAGATVDLPCGEGHTALFAATIRNHPKVVEHLLNAGADRSIKVNGETAMDHARSKGFKEVIAVLERRTEPLKKGGTANQPKQGK